MSAHRYWRVLFKGGGSVHCYVGDVQMHTSIGGSNVCTGGTASASAGSTAASGGFDGASNPYWYNNGNGYPCWLQYDFGSGNSKDIVEFTMVCFSAPEMPTIFDLQYSDDGSTWTTLISRRGETGWSNGATRTYSTSTVGYRYYRVLATANNGNASWTHIGELEFRETAGGADTTGSGTPIGNDSNAGLQPYRAFDNDATSPWGSNAGGSRYVGVDYGASNTGWHEIRQIVVTALGTPNSVGIGLDATVKDFKFQGCDDNSSWVDIITVSGQTGWTAGESRSFSVDTSVSGTATTSQAQTAAATGTVTSTTTGTATTSQAQTAAATGTTSTSGTATTSQAQTAAASGNALTPVTGTATTSQAQTAAASGAVSTPGTYERWQLLITASNDGTKVGVYELELRESAGGADATGSGTVVASRETPGFLGTAAFDNSSSTRWQAQFGPGAYDTSLITGGPDSTGTTGSTDSSGDTTIAALITAAGAGGTVTIPGNKTYVLNNPIAPLNGQTIKAAAGSSVVLKAAAGLGSNPMVNLTFKTGVTLQNVWIDANYANRTAREGDTNASTIYIAHGSGHTIRNCDISNSPAYAVWSYNSPQLDILNNTGSENYQAMRIDGNSQSDCGTTEGNRFISTSAVKSLQGYEALGCNDIIVRSNEFSGFGAQEPTSHGYEGTWGNGIYISNTDNFLVENNVCSDNYWSSLVAGAGATNGTVHYNTLDRGSYGAQSLWYEQPGADYLTVTMNLMDGGASVGDTGGNHLTFTFNDVTTDDVGMDMNSGCQIATVTDNRFTRRGSPHTQNGIYLWEKNNPAIDVHYERNVVTGYAKAVSINNLGGVGTVYGLTVVDNTFVSCTQGVVLEGSVTADASCSLQAYSTPSPAPAAWQATLEYNFGTGHGKSIEQIALTAAGGSAPRDFALRYWDGSAWITKLSVTGESGWGAPETRLFGTGASSVTGTATTSQAQTAAATGTTSTSGAATTSQAQTAAASGAVGASGTATTSQAQTTGATGAATNNWAFVKVQQAGGGSAASLATPASDLAAGSHVIVHVVFDLFGATPTITVSDDAGNPYGKVGEAYDGSINGRVVSFAATNCAGQAGNVITATAASGTVLAVMAQHFSSPALAQVDSNYAAKVSANGTSSSLTTDAFNTAGAGVLGIGQYNPSVDSSTADGSFSGSGVSPVMNSPRPSTDAASGYAVDTAALAGATVTFTASRTTRRALSVVSLVELPDHVDGNASTAQAQTTSGTGWAGTSGTATTSQAQTADASGRLSWAAALTGVSASGAAGSVGVRHRNAVAGNSTTAASGSLALRRARTLTGVQAAGSAGAVAVRHANALAGVLGTGSVGSVNLRRRRALTGAQAAGGVATIGNAHQHVLTGVSGTGRAGTVRPPSSVSGVEGTGRTGVVRLRSSHALTGEQAAGSVGSVAVGARRALAGVQAAGSVGGVTVLRAGALTGVQAAGNVGTVGAGQRASGVTGSGAVGAVGSSRTLALTGVQAAGDVGHISAIPAKTPSSEDVFVSTPTAQVTVYVVPANVLIVSPAVQVHVTGELP